MCFSAEASFVGAAAIGAVGYATLAQVTDKRQLALALCPMLFALQQACEGLIWVFLNHHIEPNVFFWLSTYFFVGSAYVIWPTWFAVGALLMERVSWRQKALAASLVGGLFVSGYDLYYILNSNFEPHIVENSIYYLQGSKLIGVMYLAAVTLPLLLSSATYLCWMGIGAPLSFALSAYVYWQNFASVWCFFAAFLSIIIYFVIREDSRRRRLV